MFVCDNTDCKLWLHEPHLLDDVLKRVYKREVGETNGVAKGNGAKGKGGKAPYKGLFKATIVESSNAPTKAVITDLRPESQRTWEEPVLCPKCETPFN